MRGAALAVALALGMSTGASAQVLRFADLDGWEADDHAAALRTFRDTCDLLKAPEWDPVCNAAEAAEGPAGAKAFFELLFRPVMIGTPPALFTGYYEPELDGSPVRQGRFVHPLYAKPPELTDGQLYLSRQQIEQGALNGRGLEIAWLADPVEGYFLQVQGSGRIRMPDGKVVRLGYAAKNGHPYRSIGTELIRRGTHRFEDVSAQEIKAYVRRTPGTDLLATNPSYVFFRRLPDLPPEKGPIGAMGRSITAMRAVAIDPAFIPLGAPVWIEKAGAVPLRRLMVAQDTGGAIKGAQRADIFYGTGDAAGDAAGTVKDGGRMVVLMPIDLAYAMLPEG